MIVIEPDGPAEVRPRTAAELNLELGTIAEAVSLEGTILGLDGHEPSIAAGLQLAQALEAVRRAEGLAESAEVTRLRSAVSAAIAVIADAPADERYPARGLLHRILAALETAEAPSDG